MVKPAMEKIDRVSTAAGYNKGFWTLIVAVAFAIICLVHIETSRAKQADVAAKASQVTVERLPSSEARSMGVDSRNN